MTGRPFCVEVFTSFDACACRRTSRCGRESMTGWRYAVEELTRVPLLMEVEV
jgi:hypothetical protein